jgi:hypothetical protein
MAKKPVMMNLAAAKKAAKDKGKVEIAAYSRKLPRGKKAK